MIRRAIAAWLVMGVSGAGLVGCGYLSAGPMATEDRAVPGGLTAVEVDDSGSLTVQPGDPALTITAGRNALDRISATEQAGALVLDVGSGFVNSPGPIDYALTLPALDEVTIDGSGQVRAEAVPTDTLTVRVNGAGEVTITDVDAEQVSVSIDGAGSVQLSGTAEHVQVHIEGAGQFRGEGLAARTAEAEIEGAGDIEINATDTLDASITGAGTIRHTGGAEVTKHIDGLGSITAS